LLSHRDGGLEQVARELGERFSARAGTSKMLHFGTKSGKIYNREQVEAICREMPLPFNGEFHLRGESSLDIAELVEDWDDQSRREAANRHPISYPVENFLAVCRSGMSQLADDLKVLCLNPSDSLAAGAPWYFAALPDCLREYRDAWIAERAAKVVTTELGQKLCDSLDYSLESKCMVLIEGMARTGKTFSAKAWCEQQAGRARYVQVPCTNDDVGFYRVIARALGISSALSWKSFELRERIEAVLQTGDIAIVFDEAHYLWPNHIDPRAVPARINWIMTALVNYGVPVALISTPQFVKTQKFIEEKTRWTSEQFTGRISHFEALPAVLSKKDLGKVATCLLPEGDEMSIEMLVEYANASAKYLAGIEAVVRRARYLAKRDQRDQVERSDIKSAIKESVIPSDSALAQALSGAEKSTGKRSAKPLQHDLRRDSGQLPRHAGSALEALAETSEETNRKRLNLTHSDRDLISG
jgi:hypothetical protein